jgi:hypothetical protein
VGGAFKTPAEDLSVEKFIKSLMAHVATSV